jgi:hypothetical protein
MGNSCSLPSQVEVVGLEPTGIGLARATPGKPATPSRLVGGSQLLMPSEPPTCIANLIWQCKQFLNDSIAKMR